MIKPEYAVTADGRQLDATTITAGYIKAVNINRSIIANAQAAQMSLYEVCKGLKEMRDEKLYRELGYQNFEEYCEQETGFSREQGRKYIKIYEKIGENANPGWQIGISKLYLLSTLSEEERTEITQTTDIESVSKRKLEEKVKEIKALREKNNEQNDYIQSLETQNAEKDDERKRLSDELNSLSRQRDELCRQIKELENRPIDVAVSETDSHEIENLKKAMKTCDDQWAKKYNELQEDTVLRTRELHQDYKAQIDKLTEDYEKKLAEMPQPEKAEQVSVPDMKETFKAYYSMVYNSFTSLINFVKKQKSEDKAFCKEKTQKLIEIMKQTEV